MGVSPGRLRRRRGQPSTGASFTVFQTSRCYLWKEGNGFYSCDDLYDVLRRFDELNTAEGEKIDRILRKGRRRLLRAGNPAGKAATAAIAKACKETGPAEIIHGDRFCGRALSGPGFASIHSAATLYACSVEGERINVKNRWSSCEIDGPLLAGTVKLALSEYYPDELEITLAVLDGEGYRCGKIPLFELDRQDDSRYSHTTCAILPPLGFMKMDRRGVDQVEEILTILRAPGGCPWDAEQTIRSLRPTVLEEAYEVCEAIDNDDDAGLCEEVGDLLLQVVFICRIAEEQGRFTLRDAATDLCKKLIYRHPHVFGDAVAKDSAAVLVAWDKLKKAEKGMRTQETF